MTSKISDDLTWVNNERVQVIEVIPAIVCDVTSSILWNNN